MAGRTDGRAAGGIKNKVNSAQLSWKWGWAWQYKYSNRSFLLGDPLDFSHKSKLNWIMKFVFKSHTFYRYFKFLSEFVFLTQGPPLLCWVRPATACDNHLGLSLECLRVCYRLVRVSYRCFSPDCVEHDTGSQVVEAWDPSPRKPCHTNLRKNF